MANLDLYQILEIERSATTQDIREAYLKLSRARHPDKNLENPHACAAFQQLQRAYETLSDKTQRTNYNATLKSPSEPSPNWHEAPAPPQNEKGEEPAPAPDHWSKKPSASPQSDQLERHLTKKIKRAKKSLKSHIKSIHDVTNELEAFDAQELARWEETSTSSSTTGDMMTLDALQHEQRIRWRQLEEVLVPKYHQIHIIGRKIATLRTELDDARARKSSSRHTNSSRSGSDREHENENMMPEETFEPEDTTPKVPDLIPDLD